MRGEGVATPAWAKASSSLPRDTVPAGGMIHGCAAASFQPGRRSRASGWPGRVTMLKVSRINGSMRSPA